ncbi:hypothetical protein GQ44DRAFT_763282 [Phaeosphaeriaceae sp. PMI808]|nr:hypothetical protein GQ44DRAFT_763282 [Phaeosphaeriaceae sp. PMI808]
MSLSAPKDTIYFGYGSNLWLYQMSQRCPHAKYLGVARLNGYKWLINDRGYANVVEAKKEIEGESEEGNEEEQKASEYDNVVFGLVYSLSPSDESHLDRNEGVPVAYTKEFQSCDFWSAGRPSAPGDKHRKVDITKPNAYALDMLVYIDRKRITPDKPREEYIHRMNSGIADALKLGVPEAYVEDVMRVFIPQTSEQEVEKIQEFAKGQAKEFKDESGIIQL